MQEQPFKISEFVTYVTVSSDNEAAAPQAYFASLLTR
jgi:hypothetical protein